MQTPIFIFSLPRSGSTLLQRMLMTSNDIKSVAEPWVLLPQIYALKSTGTISEYSSLTSYQGIKDFIYNLPNKQEDYNESLRNFMLDLYRKQCKNGERYFLDKTPRYYQIIDEIIDVFPNAKFIFLFRNPVHIYASIIKTWGKNRFNKQYKNHYDLVYGFNLLSEGFRKYQGKCISVNYEDLINNPIESLGSITKYLDIESNPSSMLENFNKQNTNGFLGDPTGTKAYKKLTKKGLDKWEDSFNSYIRKKFALKLIKRLEDKSFQIQNYNKEVIISEIKELNNKKNHLIINDILDYYKSYAIRKMYLNTIMNKEFSWIRKQFLS